MAAMYNLFVGLLIASCLVGTSIAERAEDCKADEEWKSGPKGNGCYCKNKYKVSSVYEIYPELTCGLFSLKADFHKCQMKELDISINKNYIKDSHCFEYQDNGLTNTFTVVVPLKDDSCGVTSSINATHVTYDSRLEINIHNGIIMRNDTLGINLQCSHLKDAMADLNIPLRPILSIINIYIQGVGVFETRMGLYKDSAYSKPHTGSEVVLSVKDMLYMEVSYIGGDETKYVMVMKNCYATPTEFPNDPVKYYIIQNFCPNKQDGTVTVAENGESRRGRLAVQFFKFVGEYKYVFFHCAVGLCDTAGKCKPTCGGSRSGQEDLVTSDLTIGPLKRSDAPSFGVISAQTSWALMLPIILILLQAMNK